MCTMYYINYIVCSLWRVRSCIILMFLLFFLTKNTLRRAAQRCKNSPPGPIVSHSLPKKIGCMLIIYLSSNNWPTFFIHHPFIYPFQWRLEVRQRGGSGRKIVKGPLLGSGGEPKQFVRGGECCLFLRGPNLEGGQGPLVPMVQASLIHSVRSSWGSCPSIPDGCKIIPCW